MLRSMHVDVADCTDIETVLKYWNAIAYVHSYTKKSKNLRLLSNWTYMKK